MVPLEFNYVRIYWTVLPQIFRIDRTVGGDDKSELAFVFDCAGDFATATNFGQNRNWGTQFLFIALAFQSGLEDRNADVKRR